MFRAKVTSSWFFLSTLNCDARSTTHQIYREPRFLNVHLCLNVTHCKIWKEVKQVLLLLFCLWTWNDTAPVLSFICYREQWWKPKYERFHTGLFLSPSSAKVFAWMQEIGLPPRGVVKFFTLLGCNVPLVLTDVSGELIGRICRRSTTCPDCLTLADGTHRWYRNDDNRLPTNAA
jgi:hypothetical protein